MLEFFSVIGIMAVLFSVFMFAKFVGFKKRLMAEFAIRGISYQTANDVYFRASDFVNSMNADGKSVAQIVDELQVRFPEYFD